MRDRLIEILLDGVTFTDEYKFPARKQAEYVADRLLANGVIVQVQGRWVTEGKIFYCSNCRFTRNIEVYINHRYCPHCGAKMERSNEYAE